MAKTASMYVRVYQAQVSTQISQQCSVKIYTLLHHSGAAFLGP